MSEKVEFLQAQIPVDETERLLALHELAILDTPAEERFDRITRLAVTHFNVPISTVTLVDSNREWFKSCQGLPNREGKRAISFCGHALLDPDVFIIPDTTKDSRFAGNPMVTKKPFIRFYAGVPLKAANGKRVGAFCIKDYKPRDLNEKQIGSLKSLASWAELELNVHELSSALQARTKAELRFAQLSRALRVLNKILTHDLLNDLTVIKSLTDFYIKEDNKSHLILVAIERSVNLVKQMRDLEAALAEGVALKKVEIRKVLDSVIASYPNVKFNISGNGVVLADEALASVFGNIIHNAQIHGKTDRIDITIGQKEQTVEIRIADFGLGVPKEIKHKIFTEGFKYGLEGNSGLGLYITQKTLERYGGQITVEDNKPKGAVFVVKLNPAPES